jgi:Tol biopolymer transport system component
MLTQARFTSRAYRALRTLGGFPVTVILLGSDATDLGGRQSDYIVFTSARNGDGDLYVMNPDGSGIRRITTTAGPSRSGSGKFSPDGRQLLFQSNREGVWEPIRNPPANVFPAPTQQYSVRVYLVSVDGGEPTRVSSGPGMDQVPVFMRDGTRFSFTGTRDGNFEVYLASVASADVKRLTFNNATDFATDWSPDGSKLLFQSNRAAFGKVGANLQTEFDVFAVGPQGENDDDVVQLTDSPGFDGMAVWSPDGTKIAFVSARAGGPQVFTMNADGSAVRQLTTSAGGNYEPAWSPDGKAIAFVSVRDQNAEIYSIRADGTGERRLTTHPAVDMAPAWGRR